MGTVFDTIADDYDRWYDDAAGRALFREEVACLRAVWNDFAGRWLEVGVGSGRFAEALSIGYGIDLSLPMAVKAAARGIRVQLARAERLPYPADALDGILIAFTLCFLDRPDAVFRECRRVLRPGGRLLLGTLPTEGAWARAYMRKGAQGHPIYAHARFRPLKKTLAMAARTGLVLRQSAGALLHSPDHEPANAPVITPGMAPGAGFAAFLFEA
ncbi:class I SAM-dependent methyltransferase [Desulfatitalea alkaliphila]|uniref:Class I SAM-dependent methyltransferase n=1 Tax=Desulfatitalea alkaliphila TaxID=2929485 RepID=A0AA41R603_9BACT|nr:class I SAM-dependent methyltransferase [Desulfatitalea alkaliphila]MCJ8501740.1 class I SAM-dependent methyltransferase [Desulfatitalea alkaliphila]